MLCFNDRNLCKALVNHTLVTYLSYTNTQHAYFTRDENRLILYHPVVLLRLRNHTMS